MDEKTPERPMQKKQYISIFEKKFEWDQRHDAIIHIMVCAKKYKRYLNKFSVIHYEKETQQVASEFCFGKFINNMFCDETIAVKVIEIYWECGMKEFDQDCEMEINIDLDDQHKKIPDDNNDNKISRFND